MNLRRIQSTDTLTSAKEITLNKDFIKARRKVLKNSSSLAEKLIRYYNLDTQLVDPDTNNLRNFTVLDVENEIRDLAMRLKPPKTNETGSWTGGINLLIEYYTNTKDISISFIYKVYV